MVDDGTQISECNDYPPELHRSALIPGHVEHAARSAVCSPVLMGSLVAHSADDVRLLRALICTYQLASYRVREFGSDVASPFVSDKRCAPRITTGIGCFRQRVRRHCCS
eukprot:11152221-Lingulodinium_polyedra.AAC.1